MLAIALFISASPAFPSTVQQTLQLDKSPSCTLCHANAAGGAGTATKPFALALIAQGLVAEDNASLTHALDAVDAARIDSDGDGTADIDELQLGANPNVAGVGTDPSALDPVQYGFGCDATSRASPLDIAPLALFAPFALVTLLATRHRRRARAAVAVVAVVVAVGASACTFAGGIGGDGNPPPPGFTETPPESTCGSGLHWTRGNEESPNMHPGGNCIDCHRSGEGEGPRYAIAGTVMTDLFDEDDCLGVGGVTVDVIDADGVTHSLLSNNAGNFYSRSSVPTPYTVRLTHDGRTSEMATPQTDMNCARCHTAEGADGAPGRIVAP